MRADAMRWLAKHLTARDAVLMILTSDLEVCHNISGANMCRGRTAASIKSYSSKITNKTLTRLLEEGLITQVGFNYKVSL